MNAIKQPSELPYFVVVNVEMLRKWWKQNECNKDAYVEMDMCGKTRLDRVRNEYIRVVMFGVASIED